MRLEHRRLRERLAYRDRLVRGDQQVVHPVLSLDADLHRLLLRGGFKQQVELFKKALFYYSDVDAPHEKTDAKAQNGWEYEPDGQDRHVGLLVYIKASLTGDEPVDIEHYKLAHADFPHESTVDQFFSESQFESYRALGYHCANELLEVPLRAANKLHQDHLDAPLSTRDLFKIVFEHWRAMPPEFLSPYLRANDTYMAIMRQLESDPVLFQFKAELAPACAPVGPHLPPRNYQPWSQRTQRTRDAEINMARQVFAMLENVFFELDIQNYRDHPVHAGWVDVCESWFRRSTTLRECWSSLKGEFSVPMQNFIDKMLERM